MDIFQRDFALLNNIVRQPTACDSFGVDTSRVEEIIEGKIPAIFRENAPENIYQLYEDFRAEYERFCDYFRYDQLIGKNVIALGGGFSSGKSSFINALLGAGVLPTDIAPSTSVPSYVLRGEKNAVHGVNVFNAKVEMQTRDVGRIAHGFGDYEEDEESQPVPLGHLLKSLFISVKTHPFEKLAFLDTPGYSKPDTEQYSDRTDEEIARRQLDSSDYILWFIRAESGTITEEDIKFLQKLRPDIEKAVIVSKSDEKNLKDLKEVIERTASTLRMKGISVAGVFPFSREKEFDDMEQTRFLLEGTSQIFSLLRKWEAQIRTPTFAWNFKKLFLSCDEFYEKERNQRSLSLHRLNAALIQAESEEVKSILNSQSASYRQEMQLLSKTRENLRALQTEFFSALKEISDAKGIDMPEPSEIDLLDGRRTDPLKLLREYQKEHPNGKNQADRRHSADELRKVFAGLEPKFDCCPGGTKYSGELFAVLKETCSPRPEDIRFTSVERRAENIAVMLAKNLPSDPEDLLIHNIERRAKDIADMLADAWKDVQRIDPRKADALLDSVKEIANKAKEEGK